MASALLGLTLGDTMVHSLLNILKEKMSVETRPNHSSLEDTYEEVTHSNTRNVSQFSSDSEDELDSVNRVVGSLLKDPIFGLAAIPASYLYGQNEKLLSTIPNHSLLKVAGASRGTCFPNVYGSPAYIFFDYNPPKIKHIEEQVTFTLYTRHNRHNGYKMKMSRRNLQNSFYSTSCPTKFITHGWLSNGKSETCISLKERYLEFGKCNVVVVDWSDISMTLVYPIPAVSTKKVGKYLSKFLDFLIENGTYPSKVHLIGHSLGAHVSGIAGKYLKYHRVGRVTGLDPALPGFPESTKYRISKSSAKFVDIIHTCGGILGIDYSAGDADFFPNGGCSPQPGASCSNPFAAACDSHSKSWKYFCESINHNNVFKAKNKKDKSVIVKMGEPVELWAKGDFSLKTGAERPYALSYY